MSYVKSNLMQNEGIVSIGKIHWFCYFPGALFTALGFVALFFETYGWLIVFFGIFYLFKAFLKAFTTELAVTDRRVIAKFGFIRRKTIELLHSNVESFSVDQSIVGRILNFGTIVVNGTGGIQTPIPKISKPLDFRRRALNVIER